MADSTPVVRIRGLHYVYPNGVEAIRGIDLDLYPGEIVALVGENGSGKTTLARLMAGLLKPSRGSVWVNELDTSAATTADVVRHVGLVFQNPDHQIFEKTVWDEVAFGPRNYRLSSEEVHDRVEEELRRFELWEQRGRLPTSLSGGERKRVAFASTFALRPRVILLDEPMRGMDHGRKRRLAATARELSEAGRTLVFITHDVDFAFSATERTIVLQHGKVFLDGRTRDVLSDPAVERAGLRPPAVSHLIRVLEDSGVFEREPGVWDLVQELRGSS
jgi:energy-coupling factor transport system ATP-binding protein